MSNIETVLSFCDAWKTRDPNVIVSRMSDDCFYHNVPIEPVIGRTAIAEFVRGFLADATGVHFEILAIAETADGEVLTERIDHLDFNGRKLALSVMGSFRVKNGLVTRWLDYFDMAPFRNEPTK